MTYKDHVFAGDELKGKECDSDEFINCRFIASNLRFTSFRKCVFQTCDLSAALFDLTSFVDCSFPESKLSNLDFSDVQLKECNFLKAVMKNCVLHQIKPGTKNDKKKINLSNAVFEQADLSGTVFFLCELKGANFQNANLEGVVFDTCNLKEANFTGANIAGTNFTASKVEKTILDIEGFITFGNSKGFILKSFIK